MCTSTENIMHTSSATSLKARRSALLHRSAPKMQSFRLPKETTSTLLHFHSHDQSENDSKNNKAEVESCPLSRRKRALQRNNQRMTSFRLPKDKTHQLLNDHAADFGSEELEGPSPKVSKSRRCRMLRTHNAQKKMNSFRLPKENTKPLLQWHDQDGEEDDSSVQKTAMPRQLIRQSSFSARTA